MRKVSGRAFLRHLRALSTILLSFSSPRTTLGGISKTFFSLSLFFFLFDYGVSLIDLFSSPVYSSLLTFISFLLSSEPNLYSFFYVPFDSLSISLFLLIFLFYFSLIINPFESSFHFFFFLLRTKSAKAIVKKFFSDIYFIIRRKRIV